MMPAAASLKALLMFQILLALFRPISKGEMEMCTFLHNPNCKDKMIPPDYVYLQVSARSAIDCIHHCRNGTQCRSVSYRKPDCQLANITLDGACSPSVSSTGWRNYKSCYQPCHNGGHMVNATCVCLTGFSGEICEQILTGKDTTTPNITITTVLPSSTTAAIGGQVNSPCVADNECTSSLVSCREGVCLCNAGYSFEPMSGNCVTSQSCAALGTTFTLTKDYFINGYNVASYSYTLAECEEACISDSNCLSFDFQLIGYCFLNSVTTLDVSADYWIYDTSYYYMQRNCY